MRRAFSDTDVITDSNGQIIGVNLGYDYCAEHEWGINSLYRSFGMKLEDELGYESRKNTVVPEKLFHISKKGSAVLIFHPYFSSPKDLEHVIKRELYLSDGPEGKKMVGAWDESSFGLHVPLAQREIPKMLYDAFQANNGVIMLSGKKNPFANNGLLLLDYAQIPEDIKVQARADDKAGREQQAMFRKMEQESGVFELLKNSGKRFYYLGIRRLDEKGQPSWWLNPSEQHKYESGWYTTEQLKLWAEDKGPVVEKRKRD
jgi:hypothetical protein